MAYSGALVDGDALTQIAELVERQAARATRRRLWKTQLAPAVLFFWTVTYALFTVRALLLSSDADVFSAMRFITTGAGAAMVGGFLAALTRGTSTRRQVIERILLMSVFGCAAMWTVKNLYANALPDPAWSVGENGRWAMFWAGYCASFLALFIFYLPMRSGSAREVALWWSVEALMKELAARSSDIADVVDRAALDVQSRLAHVPGGRPDELQAAVAEIFADLQSVSVALDHQSKSTRSGSSSAIAHLEDPLPILL